MKIAIPVRDGRAAPLDACEALLLYEDDHGRITGETRLPVLDAEDAEDAAERCGADALLLPAPPEDAAARFPGLFVARCESAPPRDCARRFLEMTVPRDPGNTCNICFTSDAKGV